MLKHIKFLVRSPSSRILMTKKTVGDVKDKILVIDDDVAMTMIIAGMLKRNNYDVTIAHSAARAAEVLTHEKVDIILLDIRMPSMSGYIFCDIFKKRPGSQNIPVVMVSALSDEDDIKMAYQVGASGYLVKPVHLEELLQVVQRNLHQSKPKEISLKKA